MAHEFTGFSEFHADLRSVAGDLLAKDRAVDWPVLVDAGCVGLEVPEQFGGAGATFAETAVVCEEMGRAASATSYLGGAVLAVGVLKALQPSDTRDRLLADVATGAVRLAVALESTDFVPDAEGADRVLVVADGGVVEVDATVTHCPVVDETRRLATVTVAGGEAAEVLRFDGDPAAALRITRLAIFVGIAAAIGVDPDRHQFAHGFFRRAAERGLRRMQRPDRLQDRFDFYLRSEPMVEPKTLMMEHALDILQGERIITAIAEAEEVYPFGKHHDPRMD